MSESIQIYSEKQRISKIKKEKKRLGEIFKNIETTKLKLVEKLIDEAAFQSVTLEETREIIRRDGVIEEYQNGANQKGIKKSSAVEVYDKMVNTYSRIVKQLCELLPDRVDWSDEDEETDPAEELLGYVAALKQ
ncbi:MAG: hypothetical protein NC123_15635 [Butyrivibrio sp.]|nr:hypothetical protein [Acetatifactor muris]MCM1560951.1 hypothetical protein [Butyrivibrio sp.]